MFINSSHDDGDHQIAIHFSLVYVGLKSEYTLPVGSLDIHNLHTCHVDSNDRYTK